jgi:hypothetical protein
MTSRLLTSQVPASVSQLFLSHHVFANVLSLRDSCSSHAVVTESATWTTAFNE